jgi:hypothetical protein
MAYVRKKRVKAKKHVKVYEYYQLVESYRENGKVRQRMLVHLGEYPTVEAAIEGVSRLLKRYREDSDFHRTCAQNWYRNYARSMPSLGRIPPPEDPHQISLRSAYWRSAYWDATDSANQAERRANAYKRKLEKLRRLMDSGKAKSDPSAVQKKLRSNVR